MSDFVEYEEEGWFSRVGNAIFGVPVGILLIIITMGCICWSESRAVKRADDLKSGKGAVVSVKADAVNSKNNNKLIHTSGKVAIDKKLSDDTFGVTAPGLKLERRVEMYQWVETVKTTTKKKGGKRIKKKKYKYDKAWKDKAVDSSKFKDPKARRERVNPSQMAYTKKDFAAEGAKLGAFTLSPSAINKLSSVKKMNLDAVPAKVKNNKNIQLSDGGLYYGKDPANPKVGDLRISYHVANPDIISVVARQNNGRLEAYKTKSMSTSILLATEGKKDAKQMFETAEAANSTMTWILRILTLIALFVGFSMIFKPLSVIPDVVPFIGNFVGSIAGGITFVLSGFLAFGLWLLVTAIAWIAARPLLGILLLLGAGAFFGGVIFLYIKNKE